MGSQYINLTNGQLFVGSIFIIFCISLVQFFLSNWIKSRLEKSIQHEYDKKLEEYKFLQAQRQKAEIIARFIAKWIKFRGNEQILLTDKKELLDYYDELNQMSLEISLWIADSAILTDAMRRFQNNQQAKDIRVLVGQFRKYILKLKDDDFDVQQITLWPTDEIAKQMGLINEKMLS